MEAERNQLQIKLESMDRQVLTLGHYKEETARLSSLIEDLPHLQETIDQLKQENRELRSLGVVAYQARPAKTGRMTPTEQLGGSMQELLEQFSEVSGARGAALADDHGLLVAGTSEYAEDLAVTGALCDGLMTQVGELLPLASLQRPVMVDSNAVTAAIHPFRVGPDRMILASLSVQPGPDDGAIGDFVNQASRLIAGVESRSA